MKTRLTFIATIGIGLLCFPLRGDVFSDFGDSAGAASFQGWTASTEVSRFVGGLGIKYAGSHPYCLHAWDECAGCGTLIVAAPPEYRGDLSGCTQIMWEEYIPDANRDDTEENTYVILIGMNGTRFDSLRPPRGPLNTWISRSALLQESAWQRSRGTNSFADVLQNVQHLLVRIEIGINDSSHDEAYLDNIRLVGKTACSTSDIPAIVNQPVSRSVCLGSATTFQVEVTGAGPLRYQWQFNRTNNLAGQTNAQLTLTNIQAPDLGNYRVVVFNDCGSVTSEEATLGTVGSPAITEQPVSHVRCAGSSVTFSVHAEGAEPLGYQWQFSGTNLPSATSSELTLSNVQAVNEGDYRVVVTHSTPCIGSVTSTVATLTIGGPVMVVQPMSQQGPEASSVTFIALAEGTEPLQYQWQFNGTNLPGRTAADLVLTNITVYDAGDYRVVVTNACGSLTSAVAHLWHVCPPPSIVRNPGSQGVLAGSEATFWAIAHATREPIHYQWQFYDSDLLDETNSVLTLTNVQTNNAGHYRVIVTDMCGSATSAVGVLAVAVEQFICYTNNIHAGYNLIGHQLEYGGNTLDEIMPSVPEGTELFKYSLVSNLWEMALFLNGEWHDISSLWWPERIAWSPGEAAWLFTTQAFTLTFCGAVREPVLPLDLSTRYVWCSRQVPLFATYDDITGQSPVGGEMLYRYSGGGYMSYIFDEFDLIWYPTEPVMAVGEAAIISAQGGPAPCFPPHILSHPTDQAADCGGMAIFSVIADIAALCSQPPPTIYQWLLNDVPIAGATSTNLVITNVSRADSGFYQLVISNEWGVSRSLLAGLQIVDSTPPTITTCGTNWTLTADLNCQALLPDLTAQVVASDNCGSFWITQDPLPGTVLYVGSNTVTFTVTDDSGNSNACTAIVTVADATPPVITCASNKTVECGSAWSFDPPSALDDCCGTNVTVSVLSTVTNGICPQVITRTWQATDCGANSTNCSQTVTLVDSTPPVLTCASNKTVECGSAWSFDPPSAYDVCCGTNVTVSVLSTVTNAGLCQSTYTRTWRGTDYCTNSATCSQTVTVVDSMPPVLTCASNKTVEVGSAWSFEAPSAMDACCGTNVTITVLSTVTNAGLCQSTYTRTWQATDCCSNSITCNQSVTVADTTPPVLTCVSNKTVECGSPWSFDAPTASDAHCGTNVTISVLSTVTNGTCPWAITRTWQAADCCTNSSTCSQTVTVVDTVAPVLTCAGNKTVQCGSAWSFDAPSASDACCGTNVTILVLSTVTNGAACDMTVTRTWQATDACTNSDTCSQIVTVQTVTNSYTITIPSGYSLIANHLDIGSNTLDEVLANVPARSRLQKWVCTGWVQYQFDEFDHVWFPSGGTLKPGEGGFIYNPGPPYELTFTGTPHVPELPPVLPCGCGWQNLVSRQTVGVGTFENIMGVPPPANAVWEKWNGMGFDTFLFSGGAWSPYEPTNRIGESCFITVPVGQGLSLICASNKTVEWGAAWDFDPPSVGSICCGTNVTLAVLSTVTNGTGCQMTATRTWQAIDCQSASATCSQTVTVADLTPPIVTCASNKTVECGSTWDFDPPTAFDAGCGTNVTISELNTLTNGTCPQVLTRTWQATDCCSNSTTCSQTVTVADTTPPVITCASNKTVECGSAWDFDLPAALDVCCGTNVTISVWSTVTNGILPQLITRAWLATDSCDNSTNCSQTVTVVDTTPPVITACATNQTIAVDANCQAVLPDLTGQVQATDNCGSVILGQNPAPGSLLVRGTTNVTMTATDQAGNSNSCNVVVTVLDCQPPPDGLVSWWPADDGPLDVVGTNHGAAYAGVRYASGMACQAFDLDGSTNAYLEMPPVLRNATNFTFAFWMKVRSYTHQHYPSPFCQFGPDPIVSAVGVAFYAGNDPVFPSFGAYGTWSDLTSFNLRTWHIATNTWLHVAVTYDGHVVRQYFNGSTNGQAAAEGKLLDSPWPLLIGKGHAYPDAVLTTTYFDGLIDEVMVFDRALGPEELTGLQRTGAPRLCKPVRLIITPGQAAVVLHWPVCSPCYILEFTPSLSAPNWQPVLASPEVVGDSFNVTLPFTDDSQFFRLRKP